MSEVLQWCKAQGSTQAQAGGNKVSSGEYGMDKWELKRPLRFHDWHRRGEAATVTNGVASHSLSDEELQCLIRCSPDDDLNGFFVALYVNSTKLQTVKAVETKKTAKVPFVDCKLPLKLEQKPVKFLDNVWKPKGIKRKR